MKMFFVAFPVFVVCFIAGGVQCGPLVGTQPTNNTQSWGCKNYETECPFGCCPGTNAVCCEDLISCCNEGSMCMEFTGMCINPAYNSFEETFSLELEKSAPLRTSILKCPPGMSECAPNKCCPYEKGVCCDGFEYCCPNGYRCNILNMTCTHDDIEKTPSKMIEKSPYKFCPGGYRLCPGYMNCCLNGNGEWGCCPNPSVPEIQYGDGECCDTIYGTMCCPNINPVCSVFGCKK